MDSTNPHTQPSNFVDLLNRQQDTPFPYASFPLDGDIGSSQLPLFSTQATATSSFYEDSPTQRKGRKKWSPSDDLVLISAWLNTSKDPVVGNEQKAGAFWKRIADYYGASPKVGGDQIQPSPCVGGAEDDQKWCEAATRKIDGTGKKRKCDDGAQSESSQAPADLGEESPRPPGVKAAKGAAGKRSIADKEAGKGAAHFQTMWSIKEKDLAIKKELKKMGLLDSLISKKEPLSEFEDALKKKLLTEMLNL
ncbi:glutathione S-transferase T3-like [Brassica napus]|uniref:glutathione S-transferase T3-like n=1 Tax=Brassica napus TaxID=3708 RepID=UPI00207A4B7C|nr:glutathione S-transferase T3-like [Brassica napus]